MSAEHLVTTAMSISNEDTSTSSRNSKDLQLMTNSTILSASANRQNATAIIPKNINCCVLSEPSPLSYVSGYANRFQELLRYLHRNGDSAQLITTEVVSDHCPVVFANTGFPVYYTHGIRMPFYKSLSLSLDWTFRTWRAIHRHRPDLIHASSPGFLVLGALLYSRLYGIPLVVSYHTHLPKYARTYAPFGKDLAERFAWFLLKYLLRFADLVLVTSTPIRQEFLERGVVPHHCDVWQQGIDANRFHPRHYSPQMRIRMTNDNPNDFVMLYVGRLAKEKRLSDLKDVLTKLKETHPHCRLCLVGTGPQHEELENGVFEKNPSVVFMGEMHGLELAQVFASADVFVFPSDSETLGFVVLEAMASGLPVVAARAGGVPSLVDEDMTGFLCSPGNTLEYVDRLVQLQEDASLRDSMGKRARKETEQWSWDASMHKLRQIQYPKAMDNFLERWEVRMKLYLQTKWKKLVNKKSTRR